MPLEGTIVYVYKQVHVISLCSILIQPLTACMSVSVPNLLDPNMERNGRHFLGHTSRPVRSVPNSEPSSRSQNYQILQHTYKYISSRLKYYFWVQVCGGGSLGLL